MLYLDFHTLNIDSLRWYYDTEAGECRRFLYCGSGGNLNHFDSPEHCATVCLNPKTRACPKLRENNLKLLTQANPVS